MSPSSPLESVCIGGPLDGTRVITAGDAVTHHLWKTPSEHVLDLLLPADVQPPPGCALLGSYVVAMGAANRGKLEWREAK